MNPLDLLKSRFADALEGIAEDPAAYLDQIRVSQNPKFGDYQANMAMPLAKKLGKNPRETAALIVEKLRWDDILDPPEVAGPGFINLRFKTRRSKRRSSTRSPTTGSGSRKSNRREPTFSTTARRTSPNRCTSVISVRR